MTNVYPGNLFIVAAPSGGGKTSLIKKLIENLDSIQVSISHTTRSPRPQEKEGIDYFFVTEASFVKAGIDVVLDIDWQGAQQIRSIFPQAVSIFIIPPSLETLKERLLNRGQDKAEIIALRMQQAQDEMRHYAEFDYLIVNDDFDRAAKELEAIVVADRLCIARQKVKLKTALFSLLQ